MNSYLKEELLNREYQQDTQRRAEKYRVAIQAENLDKLNYESEAWLSASVLGALKNLAVRLLHHLQASDNDSDHHQAKRERSYA